ncbi:MAG: aspartate--tRNA ligase [Clostridiaceae bacterium]|nr:aspartate--tRNA ligase [Clostridiaceae bacterium]
MKEFNRTDYAGALRACDVGRTVTVCGWVQRARRLGGLTFVTLRDRTGLLQLNFNAERDAALSELAGTLRTEFVIGATGVVTHRGESAVNHEMPTGEIELYVTALKVFTRAETTPFEILDDTDCAENLRLKYRYLDLRRQRLQNTIALRHRVAAIARSYFYDNGFLEIETPVLTKSTPEGARDYLVPSRVHPGKFYALPQSPQQYKQLLMLSGFDRYIQIVKCFRDEDLRADRQPEFTQIDLEMSFVDEEDVRAVNEGFLKKLFKEVRGIDLELPLQCMPWKEAMERFGSDKPDLRFGMELCNITDLVGGCGFKVFTDAAETGGVRLINVDGGAKMPRKEIDSLVEFVKTYRAKGLAWIKVNEDGLQSSFSKFMKPEELSAIATRANAKAGDLLLIVADPKDLIVMTALGALRIECAKRLDRIPKDTYKLLWVTDFPMFEWSEEDQRFTAMHHPFTAPKDEDMALLDTDRAHCRAKAYDIVINGYEAGGGSIRIHDPEVQERMFQALGFTKEEAEERFGHLINAFRYGAPPHGGMAYGLDRLVMLMAGTDNIRDVIAFPKIQTAAELMMNSPDVVEQKQLDELSIAINIRSDEV